MRVHRSFFFLIRFYFLLTIMSFCLTFAGARETRAETDRVGTNSLGREAVGSLAGRNDDKQGITTN